MFHGTFVYQTLLPADRYDVWQFFDDPVNLEKITKPGGITVRRGDADQKIHIDIRTAGMLLTWNALITERREPDYFIDEAVSPPFPLISWKHYHSLHTLDMFTGVTDYISFESRVPVSFIKPVLQWMFTQRKRELLKIFK
ncbi:SRPBCC family protein [Salibacterium lacus]|uniref:SRPBCC family protein n=1 Tax=Salibacterium lacus TaxID=1898109 RepID=A0ABW5SZL5_9BACI